MASKHFITHDRQVWDKTENVKIPLIDRAEELYEYADDLSTPVDLVKTQEFVDGSTNYCSQYFLEYHQNSLFTMATFLNGQLTFQKDKIYDFHWNLYFYMNADDLSISVDLIHHYKIFI